MINPTVLAHCDSIWKNVNLATMDSQVSGPYGLSSDHAVAIKNGQIEAVFELNQNEHDGIESFGKAHKVHVVDGKGKLMTPGLIDCHTHLIYSGNRAQEFEQRLNGVSYEQIAKQGGGILSTVLATRAASVEQLVEESRPRLEALLREGVTSLEIKSGYGLTLESELNMLRAAQDLSEIYSVNISKTLLAAHAVPPEFRGNPDGYINHICDVILPAAAEQKLVDAVDVFCEGIGFSVEQSEKVFKRAQVLNLPVKGHVEQLSNLKGASLVARYSGLSADHIEYLDEAGVESLAVAGTVATLLPNAFYTLRETQVPPIELLRKHGVSMAIATDLNPGSAPIASLLLAMNMACTLFKLTPEEAMRGVTANAAKALGRAKSVGQIKPGMQADLVLWNVDQPAELSYQFGVNPVRHRIVQGVIAYV